MSAIRPLATIAMLMVLGYFLWTRINTPGLEQIEESELALADAPPLSLEFDEANDTLESSPPPFSTAEGVSNSPAPKAEFSFGPAAQDDSDAITPLDTTADDAMPDLPPLPASIPTANYSAGTTSPNALESMTTVSPQPTSTSLSSTPVTGQVSGSVPSLGTQVSGAMPPAETHLPDTTATTSTSPMGADAEFASPPSVYASARTAIDAALKQGDLERAHVLLSGWYGDRSLTADEREEVENLLAQLAGTVVYSQQHRLEPPHTVQAGETLETIAQKYEVPWQLLAKINGIAQPSAVTPGQKLKVVRGPFSAVVDVQRQQMALMVADRYAGKFNIKTEGQATSDGEWTVKQKQLQQGVGSTAKQIVLEPEGGAATNTLLVVGPASDSGPTTAGAIRVVPADQEDLFDILSIGSKVIIRK